MVAAATTLAVSSSPGQTFGFTYFNPKIRASLGLSQTELSTAYLAATLLAALPLSYLGGVIDRVGLRRSTLVALAGLAAACYAGSLIHNMATLLAACGAMRLLGPGVMSLLANNTLADWFDRRLGTASGVMQLGVAAAMALVPVGTHSLIEAVGWQNAYALLGAGLGLGVLPAIAVVYRERPRPELHREVRRTSSARRDEAADEPTLLPLRPEERSLDLADARRTRAFWILCASSTIWSMTGTGLIFHLDALVEGRGTPAELACWATPIMAIAMAATQVAAGFAADAAPVRWLIAVSQVTVAGACLIVAQTRGVGPVIAYGVYGVAQGMMSVSSMTVWARYFGRRHLGRIRGTALMAGISGSAVGPVIMGASVDYLGGFEPSLWLMTAMCGAMALAAPWATPPEQATAAAAQRLSA
jgi:MFS family permease